MNSSALWVILSLLASSLAVNGKTIAKHKPEERPSYIYDLTNHVIRADGDGFALHTDVDDEIHFEPYPKSPTNDFRLYVSNLLANAEVWNSAHGAKPGVVRLLIHVHGGLNSWQDTVER